MTQRRVRLAAAVVSTVIGALFLVVVVNSLHWIGTTFPGFFLLANRVVPSIALPDWSVHQAANLFQTQLVAVDGVAVDSAFDAYRHVRARTPGVPVRYELRKPDGEHFTAVVPARRFTIEDYALTIGALVVTGLAFAIIGLCAFLLKPDSAASRGLLAACLSTSIFAITAGDLYGPHWFFRLHVLGETFMAPAFMHLALVFPTNRLRHHPSWLRSIYLPFVPLALYYEWALGNASMYTTAHLTATAAHGIAAVTLVLCMAHDFVTSSALVRRRIGIVAFGTGVGVVFPGALMAASAASGGAVAVNAGVLTAFLFPLSVGYAILKHDLFEIDAILRRSMTYVVIVLVMTIAYLIGLFIIGSLFTANDLVAAGPAMHAVLDLGLLLLVAPVRERVQHQVDRLFFRAKYNAEEVLAELSERLAAAHALDEVVSWAVQTASGALGTRQVAILLRQGEDRFRFAGETHGVKDALALPADLTARLESGNLLARYEWEDGSGRAIPELWQELDAEIIVPMRTTSAVVAILVLGGKGSGYAYTNHDVAFLRALASHAVLAMGTATAFTQLEQLNDSLEQQVEDRTVALHNANTELNASLAKLRHAYELLERNQASLLRADRLATLGRLSAGLAHEINTPLGAVLNSLKVITDLGREYASSIGDTAVLSQDHAQIAAEILASAEAAGSWASKAAAFLARTKLHGRELHPGVCEPFALRTVVEETGGLLAHRLRAAACAMRYAEHPAEVVLQGDPSRLGQVLVNLVGNALDAYEDTGGDDRRIEIAARREREGIVVTVRDFAGGILPAVLPHIFEELFTTKQAGKGTGLGLWIARNLVEQSFHGTLTVTSELGVGSVFTLRLPPAASVPRHVSESVSSAMN